MFSSLKKKFNVELVCTIRHSSIKVETNTDLQYETLSLVALKDDEVIALGGEAMNHAGDSSISVVNPFVTDRNYITNYDAAQRLLSFAIRKLFSTEYKYFAPSPKSIRFKFEDNTLGKPTDIEIKAFEELGNSLTRNKGAIAA